MPLLLVVVTGDHLSGPGLSELSMFGCSAILVYNAVQPNKKRTNQANIHQIINQSWLSEWHACQSCNKNFGKTTFLWSVSDR